MSTPAAQRTLRHLTGVVAIQWMGATIGLPLLPLYLEQRGASSSLVGVVMASFFVGGLLTQFAVGHLSDRFGRRPLLLGGLVLYGVASLTFALPLDAAWFTVSRTLQGVGAGAIEVATLAAVATLFDESERGRAISRVIGAQLLGMAIGPMIGALIPLASLGWAFVVTGLLSCLASVGVWRADLGDVEASSEPLPTVRWTPRLLGSLTAAVATGLAVGVYESCWSLLMKQHHATTFQIRLSWTLFCIPFVAFSSLGGWLADHANRKVIAIVGLVNGAFFLSLYPHVHHNVLLLLLGPLESLATALSIPSISSLLTEGAAPREIGRRQGLSTTFNTAALALSASVAGVLFAIDPALPFDAVAAVSVVLTMTLFVWWRDVQGRVRAGAATAAEAA